MDQGNISLNDTACLFSISPNYLSQIFKKYSDIGFSEYIQQAKINRAKELLSEGLYADKDMKKQLGLFTQSLLLFYLAKSHKSEHTKRIKKP